MNDVFERTIQGLKRRGFEAVLVASKAEALAAVMAEVAKAESVGWGGSESVKEIGARDAIVATGKEIRDHQTVMDLFLLSANAITSDGVIVNIDGTGNRVAASVFGPRRVVYVIGRNKVVDGGLLEAIARAKRSACPPNCRRLHMKTPCAETGECADCNSPDRICKVTVFFDQPPRHTPTKVILVDEELGY